MGERSGHGHRGQMGWSIGSKARNEVGSVGRRQLYKALEALIRNLGFMSSALESPGVT